MFNKQNFCHIASNNRNEVKVGVFVYKTTDDLATVTTSGYFNDKIVDINLHDLIIHEWHDPADRTKVQRNVLCVTERTLDNVGTAVIKSKWEGDIEEIIEHLSDTYVLKAGDTMTGALNITDSGNQNVPLLTLQHQTEVWQFIPKYQLSEIDILHGSGYGISVSTSFVKPKFDNRMSLGTALYRWTSLYASALNNGYDIAIPVTSSADTLALKSEVDLAANSGTQLRDKGVWYAKMDAATTPPASAGVEGRNYADFTQVDQDNNPIIVIYTYTSGAWTQTETITPPAAYNGYLPITSKFWDIQEQTGQQGGQVLWSHTAKTFTPYPRIISTDGIAITNSTFSNGTLTNVITTMPANPVAKTVVNKQYVDNAIANSGTGRNVGDIFSTMRTDNALNGAVECDGATYNTTDFTGAQSIGELLEDGKVPYVSMTDYATDITAKGWCDKFGWDGTGNIQFKVPTLNAYIWQKLQTGIKGSIGTSTASGFGQYFVAQQTSFAQQTLPNVGGYNVTVANDQTIPGASVDTTNSVSDQRVMVQLAISATDEAVETCTSVLATLATKVSAPDYANAVTITATTTEQSYTCPGYGFVVVDLAGFNGGYCYLKINGVTMFNKTTNGNSSLIGATGQYMVSAGDVCLFKDGYANAESFAGTCKFMFIPCKNN